MSWSFIHFYFREIKSSKTHCNYRQHKEWILVYQLSETIQKKDTGEWVSPLKNHGLLIQRPNSSFHLWNREGGKKKKKAEVSKCTFHFQNVKGFITYTGTKDWVKDFAIPLCPSPKGVTMSTAVMLSLVIELWLLLVQTAEGQ